MSRWAIFRMFMTGLTLAGLATAALAETPAPPRKVASVEGISEYQLANGLRVLLFPDPSRPKVTVNMTVFAGSRHEGYGETGMAHLLEHMLFKGTPDHPDIPKILKERGADFNGTTWVDRTNYYETLPASDDNLEFAIKLEADRLVNSFVRKKDLDTEMTVVRNEFEMGENSPENILEQRMMAVAYEWHNYGKSTIGNRSDIEKVPIERLQAFYRKQYRVDNAMVVVAGKFDEAKALELINKNFGSLSRPVRADRGALYRGTRTGRRASGDLAAGWRRWRGRRALPHPCRFTSRVRRDPDPQPDPDRGAVGASVQGSCRDQESLECQRRALFVARSRALS